MEPLAGESARSASERGLLAALAAAMIWALVPVGTRFFVLRVDPLMFNLVRFAAAGASAIPAVSVTAGMLLLHERLTVAVAGAS